MATITRDQFLALKDTEPRVFKSGIWGCDLKYRPATLNDKAVCRRKATIPGPDGKPEIDNERIEALLVQRCLVEPKLEPGDLDFLLERNGGEVSRLANAILKGTDPANPR